MDTLRPSKEKRGENKCELILEAVKRTDIKMDQYIDVYC